MSGNKEFSKSSKETFNKLRANNMDQSDDDDIREIKYQPMSFEGDLPVDGLSPTSDSSEETSNFSSEEQNETRYFEQNIDHVNLNERTYYANFYQYVPQAAIGQNTLSNNDGNQNAALNHGGYVMALPVNATARIDPNLLNYENSMSMQVTGNYVQHYTPSLPLNNNNPISNNQALYWNRGTVQSQMTRPLPSYYGTISGGTTDLGYETLVRQIINGNVANTALVTDPLRNYMVLADAQPNKEKKKRGRKPESDHPRMFSSSDSMDGIHHGEIAQCSNCGVRDTPAWRRDLQGISLLCNACGLYLKNKGVHRPTEIAPDGTVRLKRTQRPEPEFACHHCGTRNAPCWRGPEGQKLCNKCGIQNGYARPLHSRKSSSPNSY